MNDRIKELLGQALDLAVSETWTTLTPEQLVKISDEFAKLIVNECVNIIESWAVDDFAINGIAIEILDHFDMELDDDGNDD